MKFAIKEKFYFDGKAQPIISGSIHYFRVTPGKWWQSLYNLKAMGANTVETYIPWNLHEPQPGAFNFSHHADVEAFIEMAQELGLYIILRPSPYICAEWEYGGLPAWLLKDHIRVRSQDPQFMEAVDRYYSVLIPKLAKYQFTNGGNVIMFQIENEYGSYSNDKVYLKRQKDMMTKYGVDVPFCTSDGGWQEALVAGTLMDEDVLPTVNFGSNAERNFGALSAFMDEHDVVKPFMCMEFWDGWFNNWGEERITRDPFVTAEEVRKVLQLGSINFYMFQGGTNFGFYNGTSDTENGNLSQVSSYDYDAPLNEYANPTPKYFAIQQVIKELFPEVEIMAPIISQTEAYPSIEVSNQVSLFATLETLSSPVTNDVTLPMEELGQNYGYILYQTNECVQPSKMKTKIVEASDRVQFYLNHQWLATQFQESLGEVIVVDAANQESRLQVLVENMGRNNYGRYLVAPHQRKGIRSGVMQDSHYLSNWSHYSLPLQTSEGIDFSREWVKGVPAFYEFNFDLDECLDTFIYVAGKGKGSIFVNGFNLGKFWEVGPYVTQYLPHDLLREGQNKIVIFETEGKEWTHLSFSSEPIVISPKS